MTVHSLQHQRCPVSVVVPCYRCAATIRRAVSSVARQTMPPSELILVDDGSGDATPERLHALASEFNGATSIRILELPANLGPASARNAGWNAAKQAYVGFLDADASWHSRKLEIQYRFMEKHADVHVSGHLRVVTPGEMDSIAVTDDPDVRYLRFADLLWTNPLAPSAMMARNDQRFRFPEGQRRMEDHQLFLEVARAGEKLALLKVALAAHHKADFGAGGLSGDLLAMEIAELSNYRELYRLGAIGAPLLASVWAWSLAKFARRVVIVGVRNLLARE